MQKLVIFVGLDLIKYFNSSLHLQENMLGHGHYQFREVNIEENWGLQGTEMSMVKYRSIFLKSYEVIVLLSFNYFLRCAEFENWGISLGIGVVQSLEFLKSMEICTLVFKSWQKYR